MMDERLWLQGYYFYDALSVCLHNAFADKKTKLLSYMERPLIEQEKERKMEKKSGTSSATLQMRDRAMARIRKHNEELEKRNAQRNEIEQ